MADDILDLALRTASVPVVGLDLDRHLQELCAELVRVLRVTGVVVVVCHPAGAHGSDPAATLIGDAQRGASVGPVASALRAGRPMLTPDLTRVGPPTLAAAAADCGLVGSGVVPLQALGRSVGAVQLLGAPGWAIETGHLDTLAPLAGVLAAQLANLAALVRPISRPVVPLPPAPPPPRRPTSVPYVPLPTPEPAPETSRLLVVPTPRPRPAPAPRGDGAES